MMKRFLQLFPFLLAMACAEAVIEKPKDLIPKDTMVHIFYDLAVINSVNSTNPTLLKTHHIDAMSYVFEKYGIDSLQLANSDLYYASIPLDYQLMYEAVETRLDANQKGYDEAREKRADSIKKAKEKRTDSLKKLKNLVKPALSDKGSNKKE